jgi:chromate transporter
MVMSATVSVHRSGDRLREDHGRTTTMAVRLGTIVREWTRIGALGFGGPPAHIAMLRDLCVQRRRWMSAAEFEDGVAATNLLPGPASTQLAIYCAWRLRGVMGGLLGGFCFIAPGLVAIIVLAGVFLADRPNRFVVGAAAGAASAVAAVAVHAATGLVPASWQRAGGATGAKLRWIAYSLVAALTTVLFGGWVVVTLIACGVVEVVSRGAYRRPKWSVAVPVLGGLGPLAWTAFKVGALSYGGGFVIIPLMQSDAVDRYHWMSGPQFLYAVALGQITPGPVVHTVAAVGYSAAGVGGALLAAVVAFAPSFGFVLGGARHFDALRGNRTVQAFLAGAGPAAIGAIGGSSILLAAELSQWWQFVILGLAAGWLLVLRRGVVTALVGAAALGLLATALT